MFYVKQKTPKDYKNILKSVEPFNFLDEDSFEDALNNLSIRNYPKDNYIFRQGEPCQGYLFIVLEGKVEIYVKGEKGEEFKQGERVPYNFFGETAFFTGGDYAGSTKCAEEATCIVIDEDTFENLSEQNPDFSQYFQKAIGERMKTLYQNFVIGEEESSTQGQLLDNRSLKTLISEQMISNVVVCKGNDKADNVARIMESHDVSSVVILDEENYPVGIVTEQDLTHKIVARNKLPDSVLVHEISSKPLITLTTEEYLYQALILMIKRKIKHLVITEKNGKLAGMLTVRDVVKSRRAGALYIAQSIDYAKKIEDLLIPRDEIDNLMAELVNERTSAELTCEIITEFYDRLTQRVIEISEQEMIEEGYGSPPVNYSFINMGSSGRREQFMRTDLDNGIIFEDPYKHEEEDVKNYFLTLGDKIVSGLLKCGFKECPGKVMANNPKWCRSFKSWRNVIKQWASNPGAENIRLLTIFLDFRHIYGKERYCNLLKNSVVRTFRESSVVLQFLAKDDLRRKPPIGFFKQIKANKDKQYGEWVNLKKSACVHIVDCLRVLSLREGIIETNTYERLERLQEKYVISRDDAEFIHASYEVLMMFRIKDSLNKIKQGNSPDNIIALNTLTKWEKTILRESLLAVERLQHLTGFAFRIYT